MAKSLKASVILNLMGNIGGKTREFGDAFSRMAKRNSASIRTLKNDIKGLSAGLDSFGNRAILTAGAVGTAFNMSFVKTAATFERYQRQMNVLFGGPQQGKKAFDWVKQNAKETTLSLQQAMELTSEMKSFGMNPMDGSLRTMEDTAAARGWQYDKMHGALMQLEQMYSRKKILGQDTATLSTYGIDVYAELSKATGVAEEKIRGLGSKGLLGTKAIKILWKQLAKESQGASAEAMKGWDGMISNLGDDWSQFQKNVMDRGVFDKLKNRVREFKRFIENPEKSGVAAHNTAAVLNHSINIATESAKGLYDAFSDIYTMSTKTYDTLNGWAVKLGLVDDKVKNTKESLLSVRHVVEAIALLYLGNKALRMAAPFVKGGWKMGKYGFKAGRGMYRGGRWSYRKLFRRNRPEIAPPAGLPEGAAGVQRVFVTNWPAGGAGLDMPGSGDGKRSGKTHEKKPGKTPGKKNPPKKGPGRNRNRPVSLTPPETTPTPPEAPASPRRSRLPGGGTVALMAADTAMTLVNVAGEQNNTDRGADIGSTAGMWIGGALGSLTDEFTGPFGTMVGMEIGQTVGEQLGAWLGSFFDDKDAEKADEEPLKGRIDLNVNLPDGASIGSSFSTFNRASPVNLLSGGYMP
ncbi:tape measure protein [Citrobacter braakii]|uniref:tape measure protein n=1 Tax=Citrobacter braakii TaxID=57706 RepID=UPI0040399765